MDRGCWKVLNQCWGRRKGEGLGWWGGAGVKVQALRWKQGKVLCKEELEAPS